MNIVLNKPEVKLRNRMSSDDEIGKIFVGGVDREVLTDEFKTFFEEFGEMVDCVLMHDDQTGKNRGFGFVKYKDPTCVDMILSSAPHTLKGKKVDVKKCTPRDATKRSRGYSDQGGMQGGPGGDMEHKIFIGGVPQPVDESDLTNFFSAFGKVLHIKLMKDRETERSRGFGFVSFDNREAVERLCKQQFVEINGKKVECKMAEDRFKNKQFGFQQGGGGGQGWGGPQGGYNQGNWGGPQGGPQGGQYGYQQQQQQQQQGWGPQVPQQQMGNYPPQNNFGGPPQGGPPPRGGNPGGPQGGGYGVGYGGPTGNNYNNQPQGGYGQPYGQQSNYGGNQSYGGQNFGGGYGGPGNQGDPYSGGPGGGGGSYGNQGNYNNDMNSGYSGGPGNNYNQGDAGQDMYGAGGPMAGNYQRPGNTTQFHPYRR